VSIDDLMQTASACAASGDLEGELAAYRQADELGDAEAAIFLGNALRRRGDVGLAKAAYERAEMRGHPEAGMSLGNLLTDLGDRAGAKVAYLHSVELGSTIASLNLGLMLAEDGEGDEALPHLQRAADAGDSAGYWGIGKIHEQRSEWAAAADAYTSGALLGDPACSYGVGVALFQLGDREGAKAAFQEARELGHQGAADVLAAFEREDATVEVDVGPSVGQLWSDVTAVYSTLASQRKDLGRQWIASTLVVQEQQARVAVLRSADEDYSKRLATICERFRVQPGARNDATVASSPTSWLSSSSAQSKSWTLTPAQAQALDSDLEEARSRLQQAEGKTFGGLSRGKGLEALGRVAARLDSLRIATAAATLEVREAEEARESAARAAANTAHRNLDPVASLAGTASLELPPILQPWSSPRWRSWTTEDASNVGLRLVYGGVLSPKEDSHLGANTRFGTELRVPWGFALHDSWYLQHEGEARAAAHGFVRSMMLRQLLSVRPGETRLCIFDPVGLGQSAGELLDLAEYDADLIGGKVWSASQDLETRLAELSSHIELVIQKYLRTTYQTIDEFNDAAGEIAEPYRMLVLFDFPSGLSAEAATRLKSIVENGPRCGVFTLIAVDTSVQAPYGVDVEQLRTSMRVLNLQGGFAEDVNGYRLEASFEHDVLPEHIDIAKRIIEGVGRASIGRTESAVTFDKAFSLYRQVVGRGLRPELGTAATQVVVSDPHTWWRDDSTHGLFAPIGQKGARNVAILGFDSGDHAGALLVGRPGSGKSTLLHAFVGGLTCLYGPDELELYLIDFKEGVEFKAYAEEKLPHAKVIAIESDREFGLSVLESLQAEITSRAELLRGTGGRQAGMQALREATGQELPRILLVFDEFQVLFAWNDKVGWAAADLLESIIRQGRGFGVHVLLGSQSLAGLDALGAHVPQLLPVRILLPAAEADARKVLGDSNNAGDFLTSHGEGILNAAGGAVEANERFKGALLPEVDRVARLQVMREKANASGFTRVPMVFEGNSLVPLHAQDARRFRDELTATGSTPLRIRSGEPMTVGKVGDLVLPREAGANVLAIIRNGDNDRPGADVATGPAYGLLAAAVASASMGNATVDVIDFMPNDDGLDVLFESLLEARRITLKRRRAFPDVLGDYANEVAQRVNDEDFDRPAKLLVLFGVHRARDLESDLGSLDADQDLLEKLEQVVRDGPDVGVHVWLWSDSVAGASRRLSSRVMREVGWRIAGKMSGDDSQGFVGSSQAAELRDSQVLMVNEDRDVATRMTAYSPPTPEWLGQVFEPTPNE
jgi:tetratricopeptide (TPR) repeat protein